MTDYRFAKVLIWSFFLLIIDQPVTLAAMKFGAPLHAIYLYAVIAGGMLLTGSIFERSLAPLVDEGLFFAAFAALVVLGIIMYRGQNIGPDFGAELLVEFHRPSGAGYVLWPVLNLVTAAGLFLLSRHEQFRRTVVAAAFIALIIQASAMEADMWWPAIFGDSNGRAGGFAQNANSAALLVAILASLTLPGRDDERTNLVTPYAIMIACAAAAFSQSKTGGIAIAIVAAVLSISARKQGIRWPYRFTALIIAVVAMTAWLSPVLHPAPAAIEAAHVAMAKEIAAPSEGHLPVATLDAPVYLKDRIESRVSVDESFMLRAKALAFYFDIFKSNPFGVGTGFTNKFVTGPHNEWLKLAVDEGPLAPLLLTVIFGIAMWRGFRTRSPALICVASISVLASLLDHTIIVDPIILTTLATALGMASSGRTTLETQCEAAVILERTR